MAVLLHKESTAIRERLTGSRGIFGSEQAIAYGSQNTPKAGKQRELDAQ